MKNKRLKTLSVLIAVIAAAIGYVLLSQYSQASNDQEIRKTIYMQFAASKGAVIFPVPFEETVGLVYFDKTTSIARLISDKTASLSLPSFSTDGQRLLLVREPKGKARQLLSCSVTDWNCNVRWQTEASLLWPIEVESGTILFSSSPLIQRFDGQFRYSQHELFLLENQSAPIKLSDFRLYQLGPMNFVDGKIYFTASGPPRENPIIPPMNPLGRFESHIFALDFDLARRHLSPPSQVLRPLGATRIEGYSVRPSVSADASRLAFLNQRVVSGRSRYNVAISTMNGSILKYVEASGIGFSQPVFVGKAVIVNELFDDRYEVHEIDPDNKGTPNVIYALKHAKAELQGLAKIELSIKQ